MDTQEKVKQFAAVQTAKAVLSSNYYRPCLIIDHPHLLRQVVGECGAHPTHPDAQGILTEFSDDLDQYALAYGRMADALWKAQNQAAPP